MSKWQESLKENTKTQTNLKDSRNTMNNKTTFNEITTNNTTANSQLDENNHSSLINKEEQVRQNRLKEVVESIKDNRYNSISFEGITIEEEDAIILAGAIRINTRAISVNITSTNFGKGALKYIAEALKTKNNITLIQILYNTINGSTHLLDEFKCLAEVFESNKNFVYVNIEGTI